MRFKYSFVIALVMFGTSVLAGTEKAVPQFFNYQSSLIDEGGNLLADGPTNISFQISDASGAVVYEETQSLEVVKGQVSAIVGNGLDLNGAATGGVPEAAIEPSSARYLQVAVEGQAPYDKLEIVSVPYAMWAETALRVPAQAITSEMIGKGAVTKEHLNGELTDAIFPNGIPKTMLPDDTVYSEEFKGFRDTIQSSYGASKVGVATAFVYSGSQTVQGVLKDIDLAVKKRQEEIDWAKADYNNKVTDVRSQLTSEAGARTSADSTHAGSVATHGVSTSIAGTGDAQTLTNKVLVAPKIVAGSNINPDVGGQFDIAVGEGMLIDGNVSVTGSIKSLSSAPSPSSNTEVNSQGMAKAWGLVDKGWRHGGQGTILNGYNATATYYRSGEINAEYIAVRFTRPFRDVNYALNIYIEQYNMMHGADLGYMVSSKTAEGFDLIMTDGGTDRHFAYHWNFICYGTLAD